MTGHSEELGKGNYYMTGCDFSTLDDRIAEFNSDKNITLVDTIAMANRLFFMSDNIAFARAKAGKRNKLWNPMRNICHHHHGSTYP